MSVYCSFTRRSSQYNYILLKLFPLSLTLSNSYSPSIILIVITHAVYARSRILHSALRLPKEWLHIFILHTTVNLLTRTTRAYSPRRNSPTRECVVASNPTPISPASHIQCLQKHWVLFKSISLSSSVIVASVHTHTHIRNLRAGILLFFFHLLWHWHEHCKRLCLWPLQKEVGMKGLHLCRACNELKIVGNIVRIIQWG